MSNSINVECRPAPCPCGCNKFIPHGVSGCQCSSMLPVEALKLATILRLWPEAESIIRYTFDEDHSMSSLMVENAATEILRELKVLQQLLQEHTQTEEIRLTSLYWDCNCAHAYIHPTNVASCPKCDTYRDEGPDSRVEEVIRMILMGGIKL